MFPALQRCLADPYVFRFFNFITGGDKVRRILADTYIRARPGDRLLDIGCGTADILSYLPDVHYTGFDMNPDYIEAAQSRYGLRGQFTCQELKTENPPPETGFDVVLALGLLHHLSDAAASELFRYTKSALKPGGRLITLDGCYTKDQSIGARYMLSQDRGKHIRADQEFIVLARRHFSDVQFKVYNGLLLFPYTHLFMECR